MDYYDMDWGFIFKFLILWIPFTIFIFFYAPGFKWKIMFTFAGAIGIVLALVGKSIKGVTPMSRRGY